MRRSAKFAAFLLVLGSGWFGVHAGFVAGIKVSSGALFEALDAHGHEIDPGALTCAVCKEAWRRGGFCDRCRMGFVNGLAYLSRLTYHIATGAVEDPELIACARCRETPRATDGATRAEWDASRASS